MNKRFCDHCKGEGFICLECGHSNNGCVCGRMQKIPCLAHQMPALGASVRRSGKARRGRRQDQRPRLHRLPAA